MNRGIPGDVLRGRSSSGTGVVDCADVNSSETNAREGLEDMVPGV